jgi:predicted peptidase
MRTVNSLAVFAIILLAAAPSHAQRGKAKTPTNNRNYVKDSFTAKDGISIDYWVMTPEKIEQGRTYPLVLALHGRGDSTVAATELGSHALRKAFPCFVIAPFSTAEGNWALPADFGKIKKNTKAIAMLPAALEAMDAFMDSQPINRDRVYVTGHSMGGVGTFGALTLRPDTFAAAIPVAGGWNPKDAGKMKKVAMWVFHGDQDKAVPTRLSRNMVDAIRKAGGMPKYTEYKGVGHDSWTRTYSASETWNWLFKQKRKQ